MTIWTSQNDLIQLIEMCCYLPINIALCIPALTVYFGRESYLLFHLLTKYRFLPKGSKVDRDLLKHRWPLYLMMHVYVIYCLWNVVDDFVFNEIIQRAFYNFNFQWYYTLVAAFVLVWYRAASIWFQESNSKFMRFITHEYMLIAIICVQLTVAMFMHLMYIIIIPLNRSGVMAYETYIAFSYTFTGLTFTILFSLFLLIFVFGIIIIVAILRSNRTLVQTWKEKGHKVPKQLMNRVVMQRWTIGKFFFVIAALLLALLGKTCGHMMFAMQANPSLRQALPPWMIEHVLRGPFDWIVLLSIAVVFWPWKLPAFMANIFTSVCSMDKEAMPAFLQPIDFVRDMMPSPKASPKSKDEDGNEYEEEQLAEIKEESETPAAASISTGPISPTTPTSPTEGDGF